MSDAGTARVSESKGDPALRAAAMSSHLLELGERVLGYARAEGATQAEVLLEAEDSALTRFANSEIHQNVAEANARLSLRFVVGRRISVVTTDRPDDTNLRALAERAGRIARVTEELEDFVSLPEPGPLPETGLGFAPSTAEASPEHRAEGVRSIIAAADEAAVTAYGSFSTGLEVIAVVNSLGVRSAEARTSAQVVTVMMGPEGGTGYSERVACDVRAIDAAVVGHEAADRTRRSMRPAVLRPGEYPVVLEPYAVVDIVDTLGYLGFSALAVQEDRSFWEPGRRIGSELVSIRDDGAEPAGLPAAFDYEGVGKQRVDLVVGGVCTGVVYDNETARREGLASTGHGLPAPNPWGPFPLNMVMAAGAASREELLAGVDRGLLITRFHYTNPVHPKLAVVTGMTRDGTFLVQDGEIVGPVRNLRYTMSYLDALAGVEAVGRDRLLVRGMLGAALVPPIRITNWRFTGATEH